MPYRERAAWIMAIGLSVFAAAYAATVIRLTLAAGQLAAPSGPMVAAFSVALALATGGGQALAAALAPADAAASIDERDRAIIGAAATFAGGVFASGVAVALGAYLFAPDGVRLFYLVFASWVLAQIGDHAARIALYRRAG